MVSTLNVTSSCILKYIAYMKFLYDATWPRKMTLSGGKRVGSMKISVK